MRAVMPWIALGLTVICGSGGSASAAIYLWTDEHGVVTMTDRWDNVPPAMRARVQVRETTPRSAPAATPALPQPWPPRPAESTPQPPQIILVFAEPTPPSVSSFEFSDARPFIPRPRLFVRRLKRFDPPFPHNVRLDPFDPQFVWVGPSRVPRDAFRSPNIPPEKQAQFWERIRQLERRQTPGVKPFLSRPPRP
jgi:hypothetical protein